MRFWTLIISLMTFTAHGADPYLLRGNAKIKINQGIMVQVNDQIITNDSTFEFSLTPSIHIKLGKKSVMKVLQDSSELVMGSAHARVTNYTIKSIQVAFHSKKPSEFYVKILKDGADLDVRKGEVEVVSPLIHTFVPEIVKTSEGLTFFRKKEKFERRKLNKKQG